MESQNIIGSTGELQQVVSDIVSATPVTDIHTHLFDTRFGDLLLWGIDELITYHYLIAEVMRVKHGSTSPDEFYAMSKREQADLIWNRLYLDNSPISEACRGPITVLGALGLDVAGRDLDEMRAYFEDMTAQEYIDEVFEAAGVKEVVMTNDPFNEIEQEVWNSDQAGDERFKAALRLDGLIVDWAENWSVLKDEGYDVSEDFSGNTADEVMRFLEEWHEKMDPVYMAVSLPWDFKFPADTMMATVIEEAILPYATRSGLPFSPMIGVKRQLRPSLRDAGDGVGKCDITAIEHMCANYPDVKFLVTLLSRENQHELCVAARKFGNLMPFGCW
ncbi:MAG: glucuronate isomerase, partial [Armatimonadota bacterium]